MADETLVSHIDSMILLTFRVLTPPTYISPRAMATDENNLASVYELISTYSMEAMPQAMEILFNFVNVFSSVILLIITFTKLNSKSVILLMKASLQN
jgi:hypothetical protein